MDIINIINQMHDQGFIQSVKRYKYQPYKMQNALAAVQMIGKEMNPRFVIDNDNRFVYENMIRWIQGDAEMKCIDPESKTVIPGNLAKGIYVAGPTGTGKSFVLDLFSMYCMIDQIQVGFNGENLCLSWTASTYRSDEICEEYTRTGTIERFKKLPLLSIQDVGSEPSESIYMGNRMDVIRQILESRGNRNDQITLMSSNHSFKAMAKRYGDRVVSRLHSMTNYFELKGNDRRQ